MDCKNCKQRYATNQELSMFVPAKIVSKKQTKLGFLFILLWILISPITLGGTFPIIIASLSYPASIAFLSYIVYTIIWFSIHAFISEQRWFKRGF